VWILIKIACFSRWSEGTSSVLYRSGWPLGPREIGPSHDMLLPRRKFDYWSLLFGQIYQLVSLSFRKGKTLLTSYWPRKSWVSLGDGCKRWRHCVDLVKNGVAGRDTWRLSPVMKILRHRLYPVWTLNAAWGGRYSNDNEPSSNGNKRLIKRSLKNKCRGLSKTTQCDYSRVPKSLW
jgi:hypothetical protein